MTCLKRLNKVFPNWILGGGIFTAMNQRSPLPFSDVAPATLDLEYFGNISGNKIVSPIIDNVVAGDTIQTAERELLADVIIGLYYKKWEKLYNTFNLEYNPIQNYDMVETMRNDETIHAYGRTDTRTDNLSHVTDRTDETTHNTTDTRTDNLSHVTDRTDEITHNTTDTRTDNLSHAKTGTDETEYDISEVTTPNLTNNTDNSVFGFNSVAAVGSDSSASTATGTNTVDKTGTETKTYNLTDRDTGTQATAKTGTETTDIDITETSTGTQATAKTGTETTDIDITETSTGTQTTAKTGKDTTDVDITETNTGTQTTAKTGKDTTDVDITQTDTGTQTNAATGRDVDTRNYQLTRQGNIGVTTSQQMIQSERDLWLWDFFHSVVFPDVDRVLTIPIY